MSDARDARDARPAWMIAPLGRELVERALPRLIEIDVDTIGERWTAEHWLLDVPGKWELSRAALDADGSPVAFVIVSRRGGDRVHLHRIAAAREARNGGIGTAFIIDLALRALEQGFEEIETKVHTTNAGSRRLFERLRFQVVGRAGENFLLVGRTAEVAALAAAPRDAAALDPAPAARDASPGAGPAR